MVRRTFLISGFLLLAWVLPGCQTTESRTEVPAREETAAWTKTELYFGLSRPGGGQVSGDEWDVFLEREITPRFPDGLTVLDANGQWRDKSGTIIREKTKLLILLHEQSPDRERAIDEIVRLYKERFQQESVLRVRQRAEVLF